MKNFSRNWTFGLLQWIEMKNQLPVPMVTRVVNLRQYLTQDSLFRDDRVDLSDLVGLLITNRDK